MIPDNRARIGHSRQLRSEGPEFPTPGRTPRGAQCADRVALVAQGGLVGCGAPAEVATSGALSALYGVPVEIETVAGGARRVCVVSTPPSI